MRKRLKELMANAVPAESLPKVYSSFDIVGDIAIIKTAQLPENEAVTVAKQILAVHRNIKSVYTQASAIKSGYRDRELKFLAGKANTVAAYRESGCIFRVDVAKCYFSPRLSRERMRIAKLVQPGETVVNMFAGVGCFSVIIAKTVPQTKVYSIDVNPSAFDYMVENVRVNRVFGAVVPLLGDAKDVVEGQLVGVAERVLMPLPELALEYLPAALSALKLSGGWIHFHSFEHATAKEDPVEKARRKVSEKLEALGATFAVTVKRVVRSTGPNWWHIAVDIHVLGLPSKF